MIYLDSAATTQIYPEVLDVMLPYLTNEYGNPNSKYRLGKRAREAVEKAREQVAESIGAEPEEILFTTSGSEANNIALQGKLLLTTPMEHDSVNNKVCVPEKETDLKEQVFSSNFSNDWFPYKILSAIMTNNETGEVNSIKEMVERCKEKKIKAPFHTDAVQAFGFEHIDVKDLGVDYLSISGHKVHAPKGTGALYVKGGNEDLKQKELERGTPNVAGIVGFGKACEIAKDRLEENRACISVLKETFHFELMDYLKKYGLDEIVKVNGLSPIVPGKIINLMFRGVDSETLLALLDSEGVCASAGSACRSHLVEPSRVLLNMGLTPDEARSSVRFSFSDLNTLQQVERAAKIVADSVHDLLLWKEIHGQEKKE